jgi:hypothetical protein
VASPGTILPTSHSNIFVRHTARVPAPLTFSFRSRTVANVLSIGLVVRERTADFQPD